MGISVKIFLGIVAVLMLNLQNLVGGESEDKGIFSTSFFYDFFGGDTALKVTIVFIIAVIALSFVASYFKKKKAGLDN